ncbi:putative polysaccharide biosynthesis protein [Linnemannia elongata]|uniref:DUF757-domain-containing protein n=1 Tax=Linnemannia elongata AG-77 TaxID=1314771 RepID=A0A197KEZ5_9FUNG|nr:hypothetical protein BGZ88_000600 [Linnemannia elongata]OAQ36085.1 DUF757-domain-containing protein [Linnemannia elongata AG-77]KAF9323559.1 hypothetical protein BGZ91_003509 [Linnemannia elongata]KAG0072136.1 hypothetical protein BGZ89_008033 [Linnemannia elongata]KAG0082256.1 hypothetical protein BGZ90_006786 [Linnemannia elongata]
MSLPSADELEQLQEIEKQWAVKAMHHAETYFSLLQAMDGSKLKLTKIDDEIYVDFMSTFGPNVPRIDILDEAKDFKSPEMKEKWRNFINRYEGGKVTDYNFGSLLRIDASKEYSEDNTMFVTRMQFLTIEIARNKAGLNSVHCKRK